MWKHLRAFQLALLEISSAIALSLVDGASTEPAGLEEKAGFLEVLVHIDFIGPTFALDLKERGGYRSRRTPST